ncbi:hypothetical protein HHX47_DHR2000183 [Lentinula edodes]|nr:hypothetical protein HHX47_DHR2000183 [Lentinula edodes]
MKNTLVASLTTILPASTAASSTMTKPFDSSLGPVATSCSTNLIMPKLPDSAPCTSSLLEHISQPQASPHPEQTKPAHVLATDQERDAGSSIRGTAMAVNGSTSVLRAMSPVMEHTTAGRQPGSDWEPAESSTSLSSLAHFWKAAVEFVSGVDDEHDEVEEKSKVGEESVSEGNSSHLPRFMRGLGFRDNALAPHSRSASYTESDDPLPRPAPREFEGPAWNTIQQNPHLFRVQTPINADRLEALLNTHPNQAFVKSVVLSLKEGFWPWATTRSQDEFPITWDNSWAPLPSEKERNFVNSQSELEAELGRNSQPFGPDLLPRMYSTPIIAVPKPHSEDLRLVAHQSAGEF